VEIVGDIDANGKPFFSLFNDAFSMYKFQRENNFETRVGKMLEEDVLAYFKILSNNLIG
jgi:hypothetical protein